VRGRRAARIRRPRSGLLERGRVLPGGTWTVPRGLVRPIRWRFCHRARPGGGGRRPPGDKGGGEPAADQVHHHVWPVSRSGQGPADGFASLGAGRHAPSRGFHGGRAWDVVPVRPAAASRAPGARGWCRVCGPRHYPRAAGMNCRVRLKAPHSHGCGARACAARAAGPAGVRRPCTGCGPRARPHVWLPPAPRGGRPPAPRGGVPAPRGAAAPRGGTRLALAYPHVPAPDVSGPRWPRPWDRLLMPDQKARRQRT
jgi:hypothetical protein